MAARFSLLLLSVKERIRSVRLGPSNAWLVECRMLLTRTSMLTIDEFMQVKIRMRSLNQQRGWQ